MSKSFWEEQLAHVAKSGLLRALRWPETGAGKTIVLDGRALINFGSNDYLGLAASQSLARAAREAAETWGCGAGLHGS